MANPNYDPSEPIKKIFRDIAKATRPPIINTDFRITKPIVPVAKDIVPINKIAVSGIDFKAMRDQWSKNLPRVPTAEQIMGESILRYRESIANTIKASAGFDPAKFAMERPKIATMDFGASIKADMLTSQIKVKDLVSESYLSSVRSLSASLAKVTQVDIGMDRLLDVDGPAFATGASLVADLAEVDGVETVDTQIVRETKVIYYGAKDQSAAQAWLFLFAGAAVGFVLDDTGEWALQGDHLVEYLIALVQMFPELFR